MPAKLKCTSIVVAIFTSFAGIALAQDADDKFPPQIGATKRSQITEWVIDTVSTQYVDPEVAQAMVERISSQTRQGTYADFDNSGDILHAIEQDLRSVSNDKHIGLWPEHIENTTVEDIDYTPADADYVEHLRQTNFGYRKIEILPGNIGYLRIDEFAHSALGGPTTIAVMNSLGNTDALIIDLRWNGGGAGMVSTISSYFFDQPTLLNEGWERASGKTKQTWTAEFVPGPSLGDVPLFILISGQTFSAAEAFAYGLKHLDRATVVGARSKGGAHTVNFYRLLLDDLAVAMMLPTGKPINPVTGTSWERVGVAPDIKTSPGKALDAAYHVALDVLIENASSDRHRSRLKWARSEFQAAQQATSLTVGLLAEYSGAYGNRVFVAGDDNTLFYQPEPGSTYMLVPMGNDLFSVEGFDHRRFKFGRDSDGVVDRVVSLDVDGTSVTRNRTGK